MRTIAGVNASVTERRNGTFRTARAGTAFRNVPERPPPTVPCQPWQPFRCKGATSSALSATSHVDILAFRAPSWREQLSTKSRHYVAIAEKVKTRRKKHKWTLCAIFRVAKLGLPDLGPGPVIAGAISRFSRDCRCDLPDCRGPPLVALRPKNRPLRRPHFPPGSPRRRRERRRRATRCSGQSCSRASRRATSACATSNKVVRPALSDRHAAKRPRCRR